MALFEGWFLLRFTIGSIGHAMGDAVGAVDAIDSIGLVSPTSKLRRELAKHSEASAWQHASGVVPIETSINLY